MTLATRELRWAAGGRMILDGVTLAAEPGRLLGIVGPNGSGKSSLLRLICGLRKPRSGVVTLDGADLADLARRSVARRVAFVEQQAGTQVQLTVDDVVRLGRTPHRGALSPWTATDEIAVATALGQVGLEAFRGQAWATLSGGERQRALIARALAQEPRELILDEPTNHLDVRHQLDVLSLVRGLGVTCIVALHDLNLAALFCDEVAVLSRGSLVCAGAPSDVLTAAMIRDVFGVQAEVRISAHSGRPHIEYRPDRHQKGLNVATSATEAAVTAYWDARAPHFDGVASHVRLQEVWREVLAAAFAADGPRDVVDLGTGTGACAIIAAGLGHRVRAYDGSAAMLAVARAAADRAGHPVTFVQSLIADAPIAPASVDIVTLRNVLWTLERPAEALEVARRALRPGGRVVVSDGLWSHAPDDRSDYTADVAARLPLHAGLSEAEARRLLHDAGFGGVSSWQHLFRSEPYPGGVPAFVLSAQPSGTAS